jgi:hypothetical protein
MKKEFGKWLMDIAKYIVTAIMLTSILGDIREKWAVYTICGVAVFVALIWGLLLVREPKNIKNKKRI